jgi:hypothetical protein
MLLRFFSMFAPGCVMPLLAARAFLLPARCGSLPPLSRVAHLTNWRWLTLLQLLLLMQLPTSCLGAAAYWPETFAKTDAGATAFAQTSSHHLLPETLPLLMLLLILLWLRLLKLAQKRAFETTAYATATAASLASVTAAAAVAAATAAAALTSASAAAAAAAPDRAAADTDSMPEAHAQQKGRRFATKAFRMILNHVAMLPLLARISIQLRLEALLPGRVLTLL